MDFMENSLLRYSKLGIAFIGLDGRCLQANSIMCDMLGYEHEEMLRTDFQSLVEPMDRRESMADIEQLITGSTDEITKELRYIHKNGLILWVSRTLAMVQSDTNEMQYIIVQIQDITKHKKIENDLIESETFCHNLLEQARIGIFLYQDGEMKYINPFLSTVYGYTKEEYLNQELSDLVLPDDYVKLTQTVGITLKKQGTAKFIYRGLKKDRSLSYFEGNCSLTTYKGKTAVIGTIQDITEKRKADYLAIEQSTNYQKLLKHLPEPIVVHEGGIILFANLAAVQLVKAKTDAELIGKHITEFLHAKHHAIIEERTLEIMQSREATIFRPGSLYNVLGELNEVEISSVRIDNPNGYSMILSLVRDLTERKQAEEILIRSEKLSVIGQLAAGVAHEIRNPLTSLKGFTKLLKSDCTEQQTTYFNIMEQELDRINLIVNEFMTLAKPDLKEFNIKSMIEIMDSVIAVLETQAIMVNVHIHKKYPTEVPRIYCDENQIKQVFLNVIKNAIEAMPDGGVVTLSVSKVNDKKLQIEIKDHGIGIPRDVIERIGEPFFTTKANGTGLGLMISQRIIEVHHGSFHITSDENKGTCVNVYLPTIQ